MEYKKSGVIFKFLILHISQLRYGNRLVYSCLKGCIKVTSFPLKWVLLNILFFIFLVSLDPHLIVSNDIITILVFLKVVVVLN